MTIRESILNKFKYKKKGAILLLDPEKYIDTTGFNNIISKAVHHGVDFFFVGGSLLLQKNMDEIILHIKAINPQIPVILFPGNVIQISDKADGILFISLISGRNPEFLIGQHVVAAPLIAQTPLEVLPTGYILVNSGKATSVNYMSQTLPIPNDKPALAVATGMAGRYLGLQYLYLDAGSGADSPINPDIIYHVKERVGLPLIVGGGIDSLDLAKTAWDKGADYVVLGNGVEKNPSLLTEVLDYAKTYNLSLDVDQ
ncbi:geranylgeranylglyceryl/heptaprenylglyceryl phosphate synthase [Anditalea andensis]|uniref:Geranylgeranylglyceryl phosphate synthase n=1 Tax=Anditalea andensis TaxID=1048983 RepID=A0A074KX12_9BACT|nr:geranylgeranylglyceryl/heptaprenylglyceryl phosphate synthase [Anditalea andensis]KEO72103.1 geranylgeranylglyceryl phosphate synthase [Anditalea andensis]